MRRNLVTVFLIFITISAFGQNMRDYQKQTRMMISSGKYAEALERCLWFHDHALEKDPSMTGVRLSFSLADWKKLGDLYPPALKAMMEVRDKKTAQISEGKEDSAKLFHDVVALNRTLEVPQKSIELFETVIAKSSTLAKKDWHYIKSTLFEEKRYDIIKNFITHPLTEYSSIKSSYNLEMENFTKINILPERMKTYAANRFVEHTLQLIDYCVAINDSKSAKEIQKMAIGLVNDNRLKDAITN